MGEFEENESELLSVDVDVRILNNLQKMRFAEIESILAYEDFDISDETRGLIFECLRNKRSIDACLDFVFDAYGCDRGHEESGVDFNIVGIRKRAALHDLALETGALRFVSVGRDFEFLDFKPIDLQGLHQYLTVDVFGDANRVTRDIAASMAQVFALLPRQGALSDMGAREFATKISPFISALLSQQTFAYDDVMTKRLFIMEYARSFGWDLHLRDVPVSSLMSTIRVSREYPDMLARLLRAQITELFAYEEEKVKDRFETPLQEKTWLGRLRDWIEAE